LREKSLHSARLGPSPPHNAPARPHALACTHGDERINRNNHPILAGDIIGTHNATICDADYLFRKAAPSVID
jgi:hypothetical protein